MKKKNLIKILVVFVLSVCILSSFAISASAANSFLKQDVWYRFVDTPFLEADLTLTDLNFVIDGQEYNEIAFLVNTETDTTFVEYIYVTTRYADNTILEKEIYSLGHWECEDVRFIKFLYIDSSSPSGANFMLLRNMLESVSDSPYGGLYGNVYSLIQDKIYGGYPLTGGAEIACSTVSTFLTIFVLVLPLALVWLIIKGLTALIGRIY